jgi:hypothetical protein
MMGLGATKEGCLPGPNFSTGKAKGHSFTETPLCFLLL